MKLMVLDGNSLVNRAFFGIKLLTTKDGRYTNAIYGFQNILLNLLAAPKPAAVAIAWDERAPTFRHTAYDGYKATRHGMPEELAQQMPVLKELLTDLGFVQVSKAGWEADDILGTLAAACEAAGGTTLLATGDRDSLQLVDDATTVLLATNKETVPMDPAAIREKYGIEPPQLIDVKSLMGDASDNIPGVPGIGEKTALALISKFGSLQGVYDNIDDKAVKPGQRAKLTANRDKADLSYMLGTIRKDAPIETDPAAYLRQPGDPAAAAQLLAALEMHKLVDRWGLNGGTAPAPSENAAPLETVEPSPLPLLPEGRFYAARNADGDWCLVQGQDVYLPDTDRLAAILDSGAELWAFDAKPLYRLALEHGGIGSALRFDGKLAAYLLNPSASGYEVHSLAAEYGVHAAFACEAAPDAGVLAGLCDTLAAALDERGQRKLLDEMEVQENALHKQLMSYREQEIEMEQKTLLLRKQVLQNRNELQRISDSYALSQEEFRMGIKSKAELEVARQEYEYKTRAAELEQESLQHDSAATIVRRSLIRNDREQEIRKFERVKAKQEWLVVRAPLTGQLSNLTVVPGQQVQAGGEIGEVKVLDRYKVRVTPGEYYIDRIVSGLPAKGTYKGKPYVMSVRRVVPEVKDRMFTVDLAFTGEVPPSLRLGQALRVQIELGNPERVLTIPRGDFYSVTGGQWIYKVVPGETRAVRTFIRLGRQTPKQYEVLEGLRPSDRVITSGYSRYGDVEELAWDE